ncbi:MULTISPECIES: hypothetical protein [Streptosporangium]|uniref:Uncharacterized protein n=1 Tax=Streptosporangium brasiliense TaxID=47480 RepID=A0ABT9RKL5_9ACTN|nr:hypothetical protein [Streptosporangium brasiliense]MDP9869847.1 hypothetical protein [Streptosporangium brasiliense]
MVLAWGIAAPGAPGGDGDATGLLVGVAEHSSDDRRRCLQSETTAILALADELAKGTTETVLAKSDLELGIEAFTRGGML